MNKKQIIFRFLVLPLVLCLVACTDNSLPEGSTSQKNAAIVNHSLGALKGQVVVKFRPEISKMLDEAQVTRSAGTRSITRLGIETVDELLDLISAYKLERIFPVDEYTEARTRQSGMHLWYTVYFDENMDLDRVAQDLSQLGELSTIEFAHEMKRNNDVKSRPLDSKQVRSLVSKANVPFNDPMLDKQWHYINTGEEFLEGAIVGADVNCLEAWEVCKGDPSVIVGVMDEGVDWSHPDLNANMWENENETYRSPDDNDGNGYSGDYYGYNFCKNSGIITCDDANDTGHGTHVAGTIAAVNGNGEGVCGIAGGDGTPGSGVKIMSLQIFSGASGSSYDAIAKAAKYAADNGAVILQCSWGSISGYANPIYYTPGSKNDEEYEANSILLKEAFDYFIHNAGSPNGVIDGGIIVFAAGNENARGAAYPAAYGDYISVAAMAGDYSPTTYTNYDFGVDITAPGGDFERHHAEEGGILSTMPAHLGDYGYMEGTSMACPHVSGVAALGLSYATKLHKHFRAQEYKELVLRSVKPIDDKLTGSRLFSTGWSLGIYHNLTLVDISTFRGKMGSGVSDAGILLANIAQDGTGVQLVLPNAYVAVDGTETILLTRCFDKGETASFEASSDDTSIASVSVEGGKLLVKGHQVGRCGFTVTSSTGETQQAFITVRKKTSGNGWL